MVQQNPKGWLVGCEKPIFSHGMLSIVVFSLATALVKVPSGMEWKLAMTKDNQAMRYCRVHSILNERWSSGLFEVCLTLEGEARSFYSLLNDWKDHLNFFAPARFGQLQTNCIFPSPWM